MKKKQNILFILFFLSTTIVSGQTLQSKKDSIQLANICIEGICFGDSISMITNYFGNPDTVIRSHPDTVEFSEPDHMKYWYTDIVFYEILYPNLSEGLFYGCIVQKKGVVVSIRNIDLIIGETTAERVLNDFAQSITSIIKLRSNDKEQHITMCTILPNNFKSIEGAFIREIVLRFTDNILKEVETIFDLN